MKIASIQHKGQSVYGRVEGGEILVPESGFLARYPGIRELLQAGAQASLAAAPAADRVPVEQAQFDPVIPEPGRVLCVGINFKAHMKEMGHEPPAYPVVFARFSDSQVGHGEALVRPSVSSNYDFEGELALVIGREAHHVKAANALDYVAGYGCFNDGSVRDFQKHSSQFIPGKNFWRSGSFGPWLVTADEIPDPAVLNLETRLNGNIMQSAPISDLQFSIPVLLEYCSSFCRLQPGDVISTGTPAGVGFARKPPVWMQPGDTIEVAIDGIGVLRNPVVAEESL